MLFVSQIEFIIQLLQSRVHIFEFLLLDDIDHQIPKVTLQKSEISKLRTRVVSGDSPMVDSPLSKES